MKFVLGMVFGMLIATPGVYLAGVMACAACFKPRDAAWYWPLGYYRTQVGEGSRYNGKR